MSVQPDSFGKVFWCPFCGIAYDITVKPCSCFKQPKQQENEDAKNDRQHHEAGPGSL